MWIDIWAYNPVGNIAGDGPRWGHASLSFDLLLPVHNSSEQHARRVRLGTHVDHKDLLIAVGTSILGGDLERKVTFPNAPLVVPDGVDCHGDSFHYSRHS